MKKLKGARNGELDFWKFICSVGVAILHTWPLFDGVRHYMPRAGILVEFFFIVSGFLMALSVERRNQPFDRDSIGSETASFIFRKFRSFALYYVFAFVIMVICCCTEYGIKDTFTEFKLLNSFINIFHLGTSGLPAVDMIGSSWYLSAMLIAMMVIYPILRWNKNLFINVIAPLTAVFLYGFMMQRDGELLGPEAWYFIGTKGLFRAFAGISLGCVAYNFSEKLKSKVPENRSGHLLSLAELGIMGLALALSAVNTRSKLQPAIVLFFLISVIIIGSRRASINKLFGYGIFAFLGRLSVTFYICHSTAYKIIILTVSERQWYQELIATSSGRLAVLIASLAAALILALICMAVCDRLKSKIDNRKNALA